MTNSSQIINEDLIIKQAPNDGCFGAAVIRRSQEFRQTVTEVINFSVQVPDVVASLL